MVNVIPPVPLHQPQHIKVNQSVYHVTQHVQPVLVETLITVLLVQPVIYTTELAILLVNLLQLQPIKMDLIVMTVILYVHHALDLIMINV
jgi:hypothetical protein